MQIEENLNTLKQSIPNDITLVAVSKTKPHEAILEAYEAGHRIFGENKIQEMTEKQAVLPKDIEWHMIGHVQTNKVKYMASYVSLIHGVDSLKLLKEINKQALKNNRIINCLLQIRIAKEETKYGMTITEVTSMLNSQELKSLKNIQIKGFMGMATFTTNETQINEEFRVLQQFYNEAKDHYQGTGNIEIEILSMGMSGDYQLAIANGSNMVRIGSSIFGKRNYMP